MQRMYEQRVYHRGERKKRRLIFIRYDRVDFTDSLDRSREGRRRIEIVDRMIGRNFEYFVSRYKNRDSFFQPR